MSKFANYNGTSGWEIQEAAWHQGGTAHARIPSSAEAEALASRGASASASAPKPLTRREQQAVWAAESRAQAAANAASRKARLGC